MFRPHTLRKNKVKRIKASALHTRASRPSQHTHKLCVLVIDIGTFCDFRMMDNAIKDLRHKHTLVYITNKEHKLPDTDIRILYRTPHVLLDHPGDISTNLSGNTVTQLMYSITHPYAVGTSILSLLTVTQLLQKTIATYKPIRILAHCGNIQHIIASGCYQDIPTSILYFAPGFLPNRDVPFVFHNELKTNPQFDIFDERFADFNQHTCENFHMQLKKTISFEQFLNTTFLKSDFSHLQHLRHIMCFNTPLVPPIHYTIPNLKIHNVGILPARLSNAPLEASLLKWIHSRQRKIIFVSFGSYVSHILKQFPTFVELLVKSCQDLDVYAVFHDERPQPVQISSHRVRVHRSFVPYPSIVERCALVCFTGSACLQNVCWQKKCRMLYVPFLPEQYFWAKLYCKHTHVDYIDSTQPREQTMFIHKMFQALNIDTHFFHKVCRAISPKVSSKIASIVLK